LVDKVPDGRNPGQHVLQPIGSNANLATEIEYSRLCDILQATDKEFRIAKEAVNYESL